MFLDQCEVAHGQSINDYSHHFLLVLLLGSHIIQTLWSTGYLLVLAKVKYGIENIKSQVLHALSSGSVIELLVAVIVLLVLLLVLVGAVYFVIKKCS